jgi:N-acetylmuramic acid 6-phosphate etherase
VRIVVQMTGLYRTKAVKLLERAEGKVKAAIVMHFRKINLHQAVTVLDECRQSLRKAIKEGQ